MVVLSTASDMADDQEKKQLFENFFNEGKRALALNDHELAEDHLSSAAQLSVEIYGELEKETFEPHFYYGKVLLELERIQKGNVITEAVGGEGEADEEDTSDEETAPKGDEEPQEPKNGGQKCSETVGISGTGISEDNKEDEAPKPIGNGSSQNETSGLSESKAVEAEAQMEVGETAGVVQADETRKDEGKAESAVVDEEVKEVAQEGDGIIKASEGEVNGRSEEQQMETEGQVAPELSSEDQKKEDLGETITEDDAGSEAEAGPLQLAWEVLEVARAVCDRNLSEDGWKENKVEVLLVLAQCSLESENYAQAIEDLTTCTGIAESIFEPDDRRLAEANYQTGQAYCLDGQFLPAAEHFTKARDILQARCANLEKKIEAAVDEQKAAITKEMEDLKALVLDIQLKIDDAKESAETEALKKKAIEKMAQAFLEQQASCAGALAADKPVDDITGLVRKKGQKRAMEAEAEEETEAAKRNKAESEDTA